MKKFLSIALAGTMAASMLAVSAMSVSADELAPGGFGSLGEYTPGANVKTNHLMFAMPGAWQNDTTKNEKCGQAAGIYWWSGFDTPDNIAGGHGWPGYKAVKETGEEGIDNLWGIDVPTYGNGEVGNATQIIWNNYLDGGTQTDPAKNPFYAASLQTVDEAGQYYDRMEHAYPEHTYDILFRYIYKTLFVNEGVEGADAVDLKADNFWEQMNKLAAAHNGEDWDKLNSDEKTYQVDNVLDELEYNIADIVGDKYANNFFNEDLVGDEIYPAEEMLGNGMAFVFDNMVYVVDFDPAKIKENPVSKKPGFDGEFYFYYGNGEYGNWPTKELNDTMKTELGEKYVVSGNFTTGDYANMTYDELMKKVEDYKKEHPEEGGSQEEDGNKDGKKDGKKDSTVPAAATDAASSTSDGANGGNNSNGAIATGQASMIAIVLVVLIAGAGIIFFTRRKVQK